MYNAAVQLDPLMKKDSCRPCLDDWGSCGNAAARCVLSCLTHNLLQQVMVRAFPSWGAMQQPNNDRTADTTEEHRQRTQRKVWRTIKVLESVPCRSRLICTFFVASPLEHIIQAFQWLDGRPGSLMDVQEPTDLNTLFTVEYELSNIVTAGRTNSSPLIPLYRYSESAGLNETMLDRAQCADLCVLLAFTFLCQLRWRFRFLLDFPFRWSVFVNAKSSEEVRRGVVQDCC